MKYLIACLMLFPIAALSRSLTKEQCMDRAEHSYDHCIDDAENDRGERRRCGREHRREIERCSRLDSFYFDPQYRFVPIPIPQRQIYILPGSP